MFFWEIAKRKAHPLRNEPALIITTKLPQEFATILKMGEPPITGKILNCDGVMLFWKSSPKGNRTPVSGVRGQQHILLGVDLLGDTVILFCRLPQNYHMI